MKRKGDTDEKIISILKEHEAGSSVEGLARRAGFAEGTLYTWKAKFGRSRPRQADDSQL